MIIYFFESSDTPILPKTVKMNSLWGKIGLNNNKTHIFIARSRAECETMFNNPFITNHSTVKIAPDKILFLYRNTTEGLESNMKGSDVVAAFTTAHARLVLLSKLTLLGANVCYYDTDSIIYTRRNQNDPEIPIGYNLGEWTSMFEIIR